MDDPISPQPKLHRRIWNGLRIVLGVIFQVSVIIAAFTFFQRQEPQLERTLDHETKLLTISRAGFAPIAVKAYVVSFQINLVKDSAGHISLSPSAPINAIYTHGRILEQTLWFPWSKISMDLLASKTVPFDEWKGDFPSPFTVYCFAIEARNKLSNQSIVETVLTQKMLFAVSLFGPLPRGGAMGGGYQPGLFALERQMNADCRSMYERMSY